MKDFHCADAGLDCDFVAKGLTNKEILDQVGPHAQQAHKMQATPELVQKVEGLIHENSPAHGKSVTARKH
jgi:predicted small metal-binding protein